ncbi:helix-turn-helix transcriptional regulator [uncultured Adlercreutzia sp.]|uniref:helix-turn-helix transcriptional regulator n=1 Tax=uncultured Adlercreutzia sp. TaxID=875803 RepID=UPI0026774EB5|nr:helix-turn-helix transcriptional regulator [uncultured Adlercreutzia sp.]
MSYGNEKAARNLKVERAKRGWSQEELAEACGVGQNSIACYEMGGTTPGLDQALKLAEAMASPLMP